MMKPYIKCRKILLVQYFVTAAYVPTKEKKILTFALIKCTVSLIA